MLAEEPACPDIQAPCQDVRLYVEDAETSEQF
jgi:hypothetical protein